MRSTRVPRLLLIAGAGVALLPAPVLLSAAHAAESVTTKVPLSQASWYWRGQPGAIGSTGVAPPQPVPDPSVPTGDLAVGGPEAPAAGGLPSGALAETYLAFDLSEVPVGSTISSFVVTLPVDAKGVSANASGATIIACAPKTAWSGGQSASAYGGKPADSCDTQSPRLKPAAGGTAYTVDIADLAQSWVKAGALNLGVAITDNPANTTTPYQVVFGPPDALAKLTALVTYQPPTAGAGPIVAGATASPAPAPPIANPIQPVPAVPIAPAPTGMPAQVAVPPPSVAPVAPVVAVSMRPADGSAPPLGFWVALALIVMLLGATTFVLADPRVTITRNPDRGVARALRSRLAPRP